MASDFLTYVNLHNNLNSSRNKDGKRSYFSALFGLAINGMMLSLIILFFHSLVVNFEQTGNEWELLVFTLFLVFLLQIVWSVVLCVKIFFSPTINAHLMKYPIHPRTLFLSKLFYIFIRQLVFGLALLLPLLNIYGFMLGYSTMFFVLVPLVAIFSTLLAFSLGAILSFLCVYIKMFLSNKFWLVLTLFVVIMSLGFWGYMRLIDGVIDVTTGISFNVNHQLINAIVALSGVMSTSVWMADILVWHNVLLNILWLVIVIGVSFGILMLVQHYFYQKMMEIGIGKDREYIQNNAKDKVRPFFWSLVVREFKMIFRNIGYLFQYFTFIIITPMMVYLTMSSSAQISFDLIGDLAAVAIGVFVICIFGVVSTSFAATSISREGNAFFLLRLYPVSPRKYILSKVMFAFIALVPSVLAAVGVLIVFNLLGAGHALLLGLIAIAFGFAQICLAINADVRNPELHEDGSISNDGNMSVTVFIGLLGALFLGFIAAILSFAVGEVTALMVTLVISVCFAGVGFLALFSRLGQKFDRILDR
ncbi:MAG: hypothetical protein FWE38_02505 [Firmicutes bacterium]|nr:hypothetical protein [Bacillota bacterium]